MNIFWLSKSKKRSARAHCDQHVNKMALEAVQLLYTAWVLLSSNDEWRDAAPFNKAGTQRGYKATHINHPCARWARRSLTNYLLIIDYALALCKEYRKRFKREAFVVQHLKWLRENTPPALTDKGLTPIPCCTNSGNYKAKTLNDAVKQYKKFYRKTKLSFARYNHSEPPRWIKKRIN